MTPNLNLTKRERETLALLAQGLSLAEAAHAMGVSLKTASTHSYRLYSKIGVHDRTRLAHYALHHGIVANMFAEATEAKSDWTKGGSVPVLLDFGWKWKGDSVVVYCPDLEIDGRAESYPKEIGSSQVNESASPEAKRRVANLIARFTGLGR